MTGLASGEVVSVQSPTVFGYGLTAPVPNPDPTPTPTTTTTTPTPTPTPTPTTPACTDPTTCSPVSWIESRWVCNIPECSGGAWAGGVISWPEGTAYSSNNRTSYNSRTVYSMSGQLLYPYMGSWATGCQLTMVDGAVLVIEWKRGSNTWRQTLVSAGESYTINLVGEEDGAMIETPNNTTPFSLTLQNCTPQPLTP